MVDEPQPWQFDHASESIPSESFRPAVLMLGGIPMSFQQHHYSYWILQDVVQTAKQIWWDHLQTQSLHRAVPVHRSLGWFNALRHEPHLLCGSVVGRSVASMRHHGVHWTLFRLLQPVKALLICCFALCQTLVSLANPPGLSRQLCPFERPWPRVFNGLPLASSSLFRDWLSHAALIALANWLCSASCSHGG